MTRGTARNPYCRTTTMATSTSALRSSPLAALAIWLVAGFLHAVLPPPGEALELTGPGLPPEAAPAEKAPHEAVLRLVVETSETTATGAASAARFRVRTVVGALQASGVQIRDLDIGNLQMTSIEGRPTMGPRRRPGAPPPVVGFRAWIPITVVTPALDRVALLIDLAAGAGAHLDWLGYQDPDGEPAARASNSPGRTR